VFIDKKTGELSLKHPKTGHISNFSYDAFPLFWRLATDSVWSGRRDQHLQQKMLQFFKQEWNQQGKFFDRYSLEGRPLSRVEGLPLYATVHSLAQLADPGLARQIRSAKLDPMWANLMAKKNSTYYLQNWIWFDRAFELGVVRTYEEFLGFLRPFDFDSFSASFPWYIATATLILFFLVRFHSAFKIAFLGSAFFLCGRYLVWRLFYSLNFLEGSGIAISIILLLAEFYCFSTVLMLLIQVGLKGDRKSSQRPPVTSPQFLPSVDVYIPIYSESCQILEKTLIAARAMNYSNKKIVVCDDSHRLEVQQLAESYGAIYIKGPKKHAKAGNLNNALRQTTGELIVIFDTDHIPVTSFLEETIPYFSDPKMGFIQTPHHFYNEDIFQRALLTGDRVPNEQDMFNHSIQRGRDSWGGSFFVGSGAVFRRAAMEEIGGFQLISITEDIHTSQHLHARGWKSAFVDQDLAVGLTAENLASFIVQRRRWMLGCLQIFFKDNPLFCRGLGWRHRIGYFASLYYFFFPIARVTFWITPLYFLLFHWHPIFSEVSVLLAYLIPSMVALPLISSVLLPGWPRMVWGSAYETATSFTLFRSMFDLFLPKSLGFKVTPKGITSQRRTFDFTSSQATLIATGITIVAIIKGIIEFSIFGIEKDAYFFNLIWATINLVSLLIALLIAWEKPQKRSEERIKKKVPFKLRFGSILHEGVSDEMSLTGISFSSQEKLTISPLSEITLLFPSPLQCQIRLVSSRRKLGGYRYGFQFVDLSQKNYQNLLLSTFASPETWKDAHEFHSKTSFLMVAHFFTGVLRSLIPSFRKNHKIQQELNAEVGEGLRRKLRSERIEKERTYGQS
jgi:cellulose synthase (UDP-forming)